MTNSIVLKVTRRTKKQIKREVTPIILEIIGIFLYKIPEKIKLNVKADMESKIGINISSFLPSLSSPHGI